MAVDEIMRDMTIEDIVCELRAIRELLEKQSERPVMMTTMPEIHVHGAVNTDAMLADILHRAARAPFTRRVSGEERQ